VDSLKGATENWQTPGIDSFRSRGGDRVTEPGLDRQTRNWKTPHGLMGHEADGTFGGGGEQAKEAANLGTPKIGTNLGNGQRQPTRGSRLEDQALNWIGRFPSRRIAPEISTDGRPWCNAPGCAQRSHKRRLNIPCLNAAPPELTASRIPRLA
jgi:hypothetical protein